jgi:hypothetical protein
MVYSKMDSSMLPQAFHTSQSRALHHHGDCDNDPEKSSGSDLAILRTEQVSGQLKPTNKGILTLLVAHFDHAILNWRFDDLYRVASSIFSGFP